MLSNWTVKLSAIFLPAIVACSFLYASDASAQSNEAAVTCEGCGTTAMQIAARRYAQTRPLPSITDIYVVNASNDITLRWRMQRTWEGGAACAPSPRPRPECLPVILSSTLPVESGLSTYMSAMRTAAAEPEVIAAPGFPTTPYDDMYNPGRQVVIHNWLLGHPFYGYLQLVVNGVNPVLARDVQIPIIVRYADGGVARYAWDRASQTFKPIPGSYRDNAGNFIPQNKDQMGRNPGVATVYNFAGSSTADVAAFVNQLFIIGVNMEQGAPVRKVTGVVCVVGTVNGQPESTCNYKYD
ncbi:hypothetical protein VC279_04000 [Xanthomonas sp. WHRI 10064A]|uniref:hypothetical protein n=1 Tax=unclassified Xanthomonas TaxID=2643310 RepID=UPI002B23A48D|nr:MULTISPECIES: hypothetical protein [unclassified Xanthomonas]MEA9588934.1 hypothetical protein [Xanthomonas sp. WHRI 10064B]MEA9613919.1 hypothetical protein [Xanthomonas sp. WHRI 10064A]